MQINKIDELMYGYVESLYQHSNGFQNYTDSEKKKFMSKDICYVYGELLYPSTLKIINKLNLSSKDSILDLGSGLGKFVIQMFLRSSVGKVIGIEAAQYLYKQSERVINQVKKELPFFWENNRELTLIESNFLEVDWEISNIIYSCSTCFTQTLLDKIGEKINHTSNVNHVLSLRPLPTLTRLKLHQVFSVECSWDSVLCFWYHNVSD